MGSVLIFLRVSHLCIIVLSALMVRLLQELPHFLGLFLSERIFESMRKDSVVLQSVEPFMEDVGLCAAPHLHAAGGVRQSPPSLGLAIQHRLLASIIVRFLINQNSEAAVSF